jgi:hypothetical protein
MHNRRQALEGPPQRAISSDAYILGMLSAQIWPVSGSDSPNTSSLHRVKNYCTNSDWIFKNKSTKANVDLCKTQRENALEIRLRFVFWGEGELEEETASSTSCVNRGFSSDTLYPETNRFCIVILGYTQEGQTLLEDFPSSREDINRLAGEIMVLAR